ncbi:hypothetical protein [Ralstonia phage RP13]|nr:hypothetical protein [Ralstonia phage RP13]
MESEDFLKWKSSQDLSNQGWGGKYNSKKNSAKIEKIDFSLSFDEYLYKGFEAGLTSSTQINPSGYHLSRVADKGGYYKDNCRFLTCKENHAEKIFAAGEHNGNAVLKADQVQIIYLSNDSCQELAAQFNVSTTTIANIKNGRRWSSVTSNLRK